MTPKRVLTGFVFVGLAGAFLAVTSTEGRAQSTSLLKCQRECASNAYCLQRCGQTQKAKRERTTIVGVPPPPQDRSPTAKSWQEEVFDRTGGGGGAGDGSSGM